MTANVRVNSQNAREWRWTPGRVAAVEAVKALNEEKDEKLFDPTLVEEHEVITDFGARDVWAVWSLEYDPNKSDDFTFSLPCNFDEFEDFPEIVPPRPERHQHRT